MFKLWKIRNFPSLHIVVGLLVGLSSWLLPNSTFAIQIFEYLAKFEVYVPVAAMVGALLMLHKHFLYQPHCLATTFITGLAIKGCTLSVAALVGLASVPAISLIFEYNPSALALTLLCSLFAGGFYIIAYQLTEMAANPRT